MYLLMHLTHTYLTYKTDMRANIYISDTSSLVKSQTYHTRKSPSNVVEKCVQVYVKKTFKTTEWLLSVAVLRVTGRSTSEMSLSMVEHTYSSGEHTVPFFKRSIMSRF